MPKLQKDVNLHQEVQRFVKIAGGFPQAAQQLGVNRVTLWRFCQSGCALDRTRHTLSQAISRNKSATSDSSVHETTTVQTAPRLVSDDDLKTMRSFCNSMMALIDMYEQLSRDATDIAVPGKLTRAAIADTDNSVASGARG